MEKIKDLDMKKVRDECHMTEDFYMNFTRGTLWRKQKNVCRLVGTNNGNGYLRFRFNGKRVKVHRYLYEQYHNVKLTKEQQIDHINRVKDDNRISNLRIVSRTQNNQNKTKQKNNTSGFKGVSWHKGNQKYQAQIKLNGKLEHLGYFQNAEEASLAYNKRAEQANKAGAIYHY